jgi:hypothetical protein
MMQVYRVYASRKPTAEEIRFGYGARHYSTFVLPRRTKPTRFRWVGRLWTVEQVLRVEPYKRGQA